MKCAHPIVATERVVPCGQCMPCRINHKRMWTGRILLEAAHSPNTSTFLTMTYNDEHKPKNGSLVPSHLLRYINRLRDKSSLGHFRYFAVGEYGDKTQRPHYHMAIFNCPPLLWESKFNAAWHEDGASMGFTQAGEITKESAGYIAGYTTKKMTKKDDDRLDGRLPEFARMSKFPPIGAAGMNHIYDLMMTRSGAAALADKEDVPSSFQMGGKTYPLGSYWKNWLRKKCNITEPRIQHAWELPYDEYMRELEHGQKASTKLWQSHRYKARTGRTL